MLHGTLFRMSLKLLVKSRKEENTMIFFFRILWCCYNRFITQQYYLKGKTSPSITFTCSYRNKMAVVNGKRKFVRFASEVEVVPEVSYSTEPNFAGADRVDHQGSLHQINSDSLQAERRRLSSILDDAFGTLSSDRFDQENGSNKKPRSTQEDEDGMVLPLKECNFPFTNHFSITSSSNLAEIVMSILNDWCATFFFIGSINTMGLRNTLQKLNAVLYTVRGSFLSSS